VPDVQHAQAAEWQVAPWPRAQVSDDGTHHVVNGSPLYAGRFDLVREFHEPGLAPARDRTGAFHINAEGEPAYAQRFVEAWGFYDGLAAVHEKETGWLHVRTDGSPLSTERYGWCGNFQERRCAVRGMDGLYCHVDINGRRLSALGYLYAGDYREGAAAVRYVDDGLCGHVDAAGYPLHARRFIDLDVFHKGYARARDALGWFHIARDGRHAYSERFASVEPFYNGTAYAETLSGDRVLITTDGAVARLIAGRQRIGS
jgi:hypothetical protein